MSSADNGTAEKVATWSDLDDREPVHTRVKGVDFVVIRYDEEVAELAGGGYEVTND